MQIDEHDGERFDVGLRLMRDDRGLEVFMR